MKTATNSGMVMMLSVSAGQVVDAYDPYLEPVDDERLSDAEIVAALDSSWVCE